MFTSAVQNPTLSIILPCYNPPVGWGQNILEELAWLTNQLPQEIIQIIIINDGTPKEKLGDLDWAKNERILFINRKENKGKGFTLREGVLKVETAKTIYTDIDFPYTRESLLAIFIALDKADVAMGVRSEDYYKNMPKARVWVSQFLKFLIRSFLQIPTDDTQCGLKGFTAKGKLVFAATTIDRYLFDLEFIFLSARKSLNIIQVPVSLKDGIVLSEIDFKVLLREAKNFVIIFARKLFGDS